MPPYLKRIELKCKCINISNGYVGGSILWPDSNSEFVVVDDVNMTQQTGCYRTWADNIEPESLGLVRKEIEQRAESFVLGMRFLGDIRFSRVDEHLSYTAENGREFPIHNDIDIETIKRYSKSKDKDSICFSGVTPAITADFSSTTPPKPLPQSMPFVPLVLKRHILNVIQAEELGGYSEHYEDEQLKRWFLVIEELEKDKTSQKYKEIKFVRDFVSHSLVDHKKLIDFLKRALPSSVHQNSNRDEEGRYNRENSAHRDFVSKYQTIARFWAKKLIESEIALKGGYVG